MAEQSVGDQFIAVGRVVAPHGIRGELKVELLTDYPERFQPGRRVYVRVDEVARPFEITAVRPHQGGVLVQLFGISDRTMAEGLRRQLLLIPEDEAMPVGPDENYAHDLIGLAVQTAEGRALGTLEAILGTPANDVYLVRTASGEVLIPALKDVILSVDLGERRMVVALPDGLE